MLDQNVKEKKLGGRRINLSTQQQKRYHHLETLLSDLDLVILEVIQEADNQPQKGFAVASTNYRHADNAGITPSFGTLEDLNAYIADNTNDIIQQYLFGFVEDDIKLAQVKA